MRKSILSILIVLIFGLSVGICGATIVDKIVAIVNGEIITLAELERYRSKLRDRSETTGNAWEKRAKIWPSKT
jgi:hypothetical protein